MPPAHERARSPVATEWDGIDAEDLRAQDRWAAGASSNVGLNRAVDRLFQPRERVHLFATQTGDNTRNRFEGGNNPNATLAAFELVIH